MKIRVAIIDNDNNYLERISSSLGSLYADKLEVYFFTDVKVATEKITSKRNFADVVLCGVEFEVDPKIFSKNSAFAYFCDASDVESYNGCKAVGKYQRIDKIYKEILGLYSENANNTLVYKGKGNSNCNVIVFLSASGGVGTSTVAVSCAMRCCKNGQKALYLNFEKLGCTNVFFNADGAGNFDSVLYSIKSKNSNLPVKLESEVKHSYDGVDFFDDCKIALDKQSINAEDINKLLNNLILKDDYNRIIIDTDFSFDSTQLAILNKADKIIFVSDGSEISNVKTLSALKSFEVLENQSEEINILKKSQLLYNKFSSKSGKKLTDININTIGGINKIEGLSEKNLAMKISEYSVLDNI